MFRSGIKMLLSDNCNYSDLSLPTNHAFYRTKSPLKVFKTNEPLKLPNGWHSAVTGSFFSWGLDENIDGTLTYVCHKLKLLYHHQHVIVTVWTCLLGHGNYQAKYLLSVFSSFSFQERSNTWMDECVVINPHLSTGQVQLWVGLSLRV